MEFENYQSRFVLDWVIVSFFVVFIMFIVSYIVIWVYLSYLLEINI